MSGVVEIVRASAGSGKTYLLAVEYIASALHHPTAFVNILAVTFTNKATAEMKERIIKQLWLLSRGEDLPFAQEVSKKSSIPLERIAQRSQDTLNAILRDYSAFSVLTIDKFFQRIVRSFFKELGLDMNYEVLIDRKAAVEMAVDTVMDSSSVDVELHRQISAIVNKMMDDSKRVDVKSELVKVLSSSLNRDENLDTAAQRGVLEIEHDFAELKQEYQSQREAILSRCQRVCQLLAENGLAPSDFKGGSRSFVHYFFKVHSSGEISGYNKGFATAAISGDEKDFVTAKQNVGQVKEVLGELMQLTTEVKRLYDETLQSRVTFELLNKNFLFFLLLTNLKSEFHKILAQNSEISINRTTELVRSIASEVEVPFIFERLGSRYSTIFIDEFQDTSINQWEGFLPLITEAASIAESRCVMLIGDIKQAIYRFRGGDWRLIGGVAQMQLEQMVMDKPLLLDTSWRSEAQIVDFNNRVMRKVANLADGCIRDYVAEGVENFEEVTSEFQEGLTDILPAAYSDMEQRVAPFREGSSQGYVELINEPEEMTLSWVGTRIRDLISRGYNPSSIAILVRTGSQGVAIAGELLRLGIDFISDEVLKIGTSKVVRFIISVLNISVSGVNSIEQAQINHFLGREFNEELSEDILELVERLRYCNSLEALDEVVRHFKLEDNESYFILSLSDIIFNFAKREGYDLRAFLDAWGSGGLSDSNIVLPSSKGAVRIVTIHKSKGLEFDAILLPYASWALFPGLLTTIYANSHNPRYSLFNGVPIQYVKALRDSCYQEQYLDEGISGAVDNINLLYVALTRAKSELYIGMNTNLRVKSVGKLMQEVVEELYLDCYKKDRLGLEDLMSYQIGEPLVKKSKNNSIEESVDLEVVDFKEYRSYGEVRLRGEVL